MAIAVLNSTIAKSYLADCLYERRRRFAICLFIFLTSLSTGLAQTTEPISDQDQTATLAAKYGGSVRMIESNGIALRIVEAGSGPLVILVHGWPESWFSWRHQIQALVAAGYHVVAPDMRGYGGSSRPPNIEDYDILQLTADVAGIVPAVGATEAILVGHD